MPGPPAEPATVAPVSRRHAGRTSLPPSFSLVAAAVAPHRSSHEKPAAAYTKDVRRTEEDVDVHISRRRNVRKRMRRPTTIVTVVLT